MIASIYPRLAVVATAVCLSACGGDGSGGAAVLPEANAVPDSALASPQAYTSYVGALAADDQSEPVLLNGLVAPVSDIAEPLPVS